MNLKLHIKKLGPFIFFLGIEIAYSPAWIFLSQNKYVLNLLKEISCIDCKPISTYPIDPNDKLSKDDKIQLVDEELYQRLIGKFIYLSHTRPNLSYLVSMLSQFMHCPNTLHLQPAHRVLRYLKGIIGFELMFKKG